MIWPTAVTTTPLIVTLLGSSSDSKTIVPVVVSAVRGRGSTRAIRRGLAGARRRQACFVDARRGIFDAGGLVGGLDQDRRLVVLVDERLPRTRAADSRARSAESGRRAATPGSSGPTGTVEIAAARLRRCRRQIAARGRAGLAIDQQGGEVGRGNFDVAEHELRHEHRAVDDHHLACRRAGR